MKKKTICIVVIIVLLSINLGLFFSGNGSVKSNPKNTFFDSNDMDQISSIVFRGKDSIVMSKTGEGWILNDLYDVDERFFNTLVSILDRIEIVRKVDEDAWEGEVLGSAEIEFDFKSRYRFEFATNATKTKSYFLFDGIVSEVTVPGYKDNVVDIFMLHPDQWRNRLVFDGSWRSIQKLEIERTDQELITIAFDDTFFLVNGNPVQDSSAVVDYLNQFQFFEANEMISKGRFPQFDSLVNTEPRGSVKIDDIKFDETITLFIYPNLKGQAYHLLKKENQMMVVDARRVEGLLPSLLDFMGSD